MKDCDYSSCYLRPVNADDIELLYQWANDDLTRKNAFHTERISPQEHQRWFSDLLHDANQKQYMMMKDGEAVGQVRLSIKGRDAVIDYSIAPEKRGMGYGNELISLAVREVRAKIPLVKRLLGKVKSSNAASVKCFEKNSFERTYSQFELMI